MLNQHIALYCVGLTWLGGTIAPIQMLAQSPPASLSSAENQRMVADRLRQQADQLQQEAQFQQALHIYQQALTVYQEIGDRRNIAVTLNQMGLIYNSLGQYLQAHDVLQQALELHQQTGNTAGAGVTLANLGLVLSHLGQYAQALDYYQQALDKSRAGADRDDEGTLLSSIGSIYRTLGQYDIALDYFQQALTLQQTAITGIFQLGTTLNLIGLTYNDRGEYETALNYLQQAWDMHQKTQNRVEAAVALTNLGLVHSNLTNYPLALDYYQQALTIHQETESRALAAVTLNNIAGVYESLQQDQPALSNYQHAWQMTQDIGDRYGQAVILNNFGYFLQRRHHPELAIAFLKQAVNQWESLRGGLTALSTEQQQSFTDTVASTYRLLADLLLQQGRVLEGQQVLDLLKLQELDEYLRGLPANPQTAQGVNLWEAEQQILERYTALNATDSESSSNNLFNDPEILTHVEQLRRHAREQTLNPALLSNLQRTLRDVDQQVALFYPLILDDRLELILLIPNAAPIQRTVPIGRAEVETTIAQFRQDLTSKVGAIRTESAQHLYDWLIRPLEPDLTQAQIKTLLLAADGQLRYVPLAALHDGQQWLIQRFQVNYITAASLTDFANATPRRLPRQVLAAAFSDVQQILKFTIGSQEFSFAGLQFAGLEVDAIASTIPATTRLFNQSFSRAAIETQMQQASVVHLATHAELVSGEPEASFILFGNGDRISLRDIANWQMSGVDLVVLSACKTALGGHLGNGEEILGFGYQIQRTGAKAAIATLWAVDDGSTQAFMKVFYATLEQGMSPAMALRQAQLSLIAEPDVDTPSGTPRLDRPYYWAPFVLIGHGW
jgi:CHAT domain-containing protein/Tfp pilus assembly protein PilF